MRLTRTRVLPMAAALACTGAASAHHSIAAVYDSSRQVTVEGRVSEFLFINPHPVLVIDVAPPGAVPEPWRLELDNRSELAEIGIDPTTFKPGDRVIATGSAGRKNALTLYATKVERPADGLLYEQIGYSPRIKRPRAN
jgi:NADPH:quinone reductase-like Zn-dependent oxidoreductase